MPFFERGDVSLYYEEYGSGYPLLLFAPGGMRSSIDFWHRAPFDPTADLSGDFRVIALDQRNAGKSRAPIRAGDGWDDYTADHLALMDHLGIEKAHLMGGCIGSSYSLGLIKAARDRVSAAVLQNPIGLTATNRQVWWDLFNGWAAEMQQQQAGLDETTLAPFRQRMYGGDFVFNVSRDFVRACQTPLLILAGDDQFHPAPISREIADLAPNVEIIETWKEPDVVAETVRRVRAFLESQTPVAV
jgi:pimeloyl-ACP methyl ester carboxylesterase